MVPYSCVFDGDIDLFLFVSVELRHFLSSCGTEPVHISVVFPFIYGYKKLNSRCGAANNDCAIFFI